jgi:MFS family permease
MRASDVALSLRNFVGPVRERPQIGVLLVIVSLVMSGNALVAPVLSLYGASFAASSTLVGMVITVFGAARLFVNYPAGLLSQHIGRRPLLGVGPMIIVIGSVGAALAPTIEWLLLWRFVQGIGSGIYMTTSLAALADVSQDGSRGRIMALYQASLWLGVGFGPVIGGTLAHHFGLAAPFWAYGIVCAAAAVAVWWQLDETAELHLKARETGEAAIPVAAPPQLRRDPAFLALCGLTFGTFFTRTASQWLMIPLLAHTRHGLSVDLIGVALAVTAAGTLIMLPAAGILIDRGLARRVIIGSVVTMTLALCLIALGTHPVLFWSGMLLLGLGMGLSSPAVAAYSTEIIPRPAFGPGMGILRTCGDVGFVLGPLLVGMLDDLGDLGTTGGILFNSLVLGGVTLVFAVVTAPPR